MQKPIQINLGYLMAGVHGHHSLVETQSKVTNGGKKERNNVLLSSLSASKILLGIVILQHIDRKIGVCTLFLGSSLVLSATVDTETLVSFPTLQKH